ncbi:MAG: type II toxin-antitoxin system HicB family antitoxin [Anaerolineae bacterium]|nr:type II toxin-antitoxin system HicB family antitoxin [Anaerolineae bacterium]
MSATYQFDVMIKQTQDGQFLAAIPVLPGCFSTGKTVEEAKGKAIAAAKCYCWNMIENGAPVPQVVSGAPVVVKKISVQL